MNPSLDELLLLQLLLFLRSSTTTVTTTIFTLLYNYCYYYYSYAPLQLLLLLLLPHTITVYREFSLKEGMQEVDTVSAEDFLDDGTPIRLAVTIDRKHGSAVFDFEGTGPQIYGNLNAPPAVTASAIIYCLRCLLPESDIPLNQVWLV